MHSEIGTSLLRSVGEHVDRNLIEIGTSLLRSVGEHVASNRFGHVFLIVDSPFWSCFFNSRLTLRYGTVQSIPGSVPLMDLFGAN
jgi:hypothetical protein